MYINGSRRNQLEIVDFLDTYEPKGIGFGNIYENTPEESAQNSPDCGLQLIIVLLCNKRKQIIITLLLFIHFQIPYVFPAVHRKTSGSYLMVVQNHSKTPFH